MAKAWSLYSIKSALRLPETIENPALMESPMTPKHSISLGCIAEVTDIIKNSGRKSIIFIK
jgi:hypothetical protein